MSPPNPRSSAVPYVNVKITRGPDVTREKKAALVAGINQLLVEILHKRPEHIHIVIDEIDEDNWGFAGMLTTDYRKQQAG
nr:4-oxalocrotonate tautomerase family protein [Methylocystis sp. Sn-Cys]